MLEVTTAQAASVVTAALLGVVIAFQLALAGGAPWGDLAYGGRAAQSDGRLRRGHRLERWGAGTVTALLSILCVLIALRG
jgi:hypothetical protein